MALKPVPVTELSLTNLMYNSLPVDEIGEIELQRRRSKGELAELLSYTWNRKSHRILNIGRGVIWDNEGLICNAERFKIWQDYCLPVVFPLSVRLNPHCLSTCYFQECCECLNKSNAYITWTWIWIWSLSWIYFMFKVLRQIYLQYLKTVMIYNRDVNILNWIHRSMLKVNAFCCVDWPQ